MRPDMNKGLVDIDQADNVCVFVNFISRKPQRIAAAVQPLVDLQGTLRQVGMLCFERLQNVIPVFRSLFENKKLINGKIFFVYQCFRDLGHPNVMQQGHHPYLYLTGFRKFQGRGHLDSINSYIY